MTRVLAIRPEVRLLYLTRDLLPFLALIRVKSHVLLLELFHPREVVFPNCLALYLPDSRNPLIPRRDS